jgi:uncharacterized membrane protein YhiD involved in acid resistance
MSRWIVEALWYGPQMLALALFVAAMIGLAVGLYRQEARWEAGKGRS